MKPFETRVPAKWVLAGEHAVLRGATAVALPHPELGLQLRFRPSESGGGLRIEPPQASAAIRELLSGIADLRAAEPSGELSVESTIPVGAGLGSSAALCVAITRWLAEPLGLAPEQYRDFATRLENVFHGQSSGMDIAVCLAGAPIRFTRAQGASSLQIKRLPVFTFHDTGLRARTSECIERVQAHRRQNEAQALRADQLMAEASVCAVEGLKLFDAGETRLGLERVSHAMFLSHECFEAWGLLPPEAIRLRSELLSQGALAAKLTGAGGGGMVVALWDRVK